MQEMAVEEFEFCEPTIYEFSRLFGQVMQSWSSEDKTVTVMCIS